MVALHAADWLVLPRKCEPGRETPLFAGVFFILHLTLVFHQNYLLTKLWWSFCKLQSIWIKKEKVQWIKRKEIFFYFETNTKNNDIHLHLTEKKRGEKTLHDHWKFKRKLFSCSLLRLSHSFETSCTLLWSKAAQKTYVLRIQANIQKAFNGLTVCFLVCKKVLKPKVYQPEFCSTHCRESICALRILQICWSWKTPPVISTDHTTIH